MPARTPTPQERGSPFCTTKPWPIFKHLGGFGNLSLFPPSLPYPVPGQCPQAGLPRCPQPEEKPTRSGPDSTGSTSPPAPHRFADPTRQRSAPSLLPLHSHSSPVSSRTQDPGFPESKRSPGMLPRGKGPTELTTLCPLCWMKPRQLLKWKLQLPEQGHSQQGQDF